MTLRSSLSSTEVKVRKRSRILLCTILTLATSAILAAPSHVLAQPILNPANGHYYDQVAVSGGITWAEAREAAAARTFSGLRGHLLTINSAAENAFVRQHLSSIIDGLQWHTGGYQDITAPDYSEPAGGWRWITGEAFLYTNWMPGEPNNALGFPPPETVLILASNGMWNDIPEPSRHGGYLIEYDQLLSLVSGRITLQGAVNQAQFLVFDFRPEGTETVFRRTLTLNPDRTFSITNLPRARYQVWIKGQKWLAKLLTVDTTNGDVTNIQTTLRAGDANGDNIVDVADLAALIESFDAEPDSPNWNGGKADFNTDDIVDLLDLDLLIRNFDAEGDM